MKSSNDKSQVPAQIADICDRLARVFDILQKLSIDQAVKYGYCRDRFEERRDFYGQVPYYEGLEDVRAPLEKFEEFINFKKKQIETQPIDISSGALIVSTSSTVSDVIVFSLDSAPSGPIVQAKEPPWWTPDRIEQCAQEFDDISPGLGSLLKGAWETYYGTTHEPARNSVTNLRQLWDQFFRFIAPDDKVRQSEFFVEKQPPEKNKVHRSERIKYAVSIINNRKFAEYLDSQTANLLELHDKLHILHKDGPIERACVRDTIIATAELLLDWVKATKSDR